MKRLFALLTALLICFLTCINVSATQLNVTTITINGVDVEFSEHSLLTYEEKLIVAEEIVYGHEDENKTTYGLACTLFGHKYTIERVTSITHCASNTAPRCLVEIWEISVCSRCDDTMKTLVSQYYSYCCD